ncbi:MAG: GNAT family N-acetyltransferase [Rubrivivax sp.]|nr:GNAT family N-acetyltransferase [Rubrivivax sp.]
MMNDPLVFPGTMQLPYTEAAAWRTRLAEQSGGSAQMELHLAAVHDGRLIASAGLHPAGNAVRRRHAMGLGISVSGPWQGQGVGDLLMHALCEHADRWLGILRIELTVYADNARAIALYRRHGFETEGLMRAFALRDGAYVDTVAMARLRPGGPVASLRGSPGSAGWGDGSG